MIGGTKREKHDDPLPQSGRTRDRRGIPKDQDERVPNIRITSTALLTNKTPSGTHRAPGRYEASFFCERLIELAAGDLGIDSAEMRRRNLIGAAEMPYKLPRLEPGGPAVDTDATAAITARHSTAASPSSVGQKNAHCKAD